MVHHRFIGRLARIWMIAVWAFAIAPPSVSAQQPPPRQQEVTQTQPSVTAAWSTVGGEGFTIRIPKGWRYSLPQQRVAGLYTLLLSGPGCLPAKGSGCPRGDTATLAISAERLDNPALTGTPLAERLRKRGYRAENVLLRGVAATRWTPSTTGQGANAIISLERNGVRYLIWHDAAQSGKPAARSLISLMLGTMELRPKTAPRAATGLTPPAAKLTAPAPVSSAGLARSAPPLVFYDVLAAMQYAVDYAEDPRNSDGCYVYRNGQCGPLSDPDIPRADGAHFIACLLKAANLSYQGVPQSRCNGPGGVNSIIDVGTLRNMLVALPHDIISQSEALPGDILIISNQNRTSYCWSGFVMQDSTSPGGVQVAVHSINNTPDPDVIDADPDGLFCGAFATDNREYLRLRYDDQAPTVVFTAPEEGRMPSGQQLNLQWAGQENPIPGGSWVRSYSLSRSLNGGPFVPITLLNTVALSQVVTLNSPCSVATFAITGVDLAGNRSLADTLSFTVNLPGDFAGDGLIDAGDVAAVQSAIGSANGQAEYQAALDLNADGRINADDVMWIRRHRGDRCP